MIPTRPSLRTCPIPSRRAACLLLAALVLGLSACTTPKGPGSQAAARDKASDSQAAARAERAHLERLEREIDRLRSDLDRAEAAMTATDSELSAGRNRASAVSMLVEARIALEQAERSVPWQLAVVEAGRKKLAEGERQLSAGHAAEAVYFASRAQHLADSLIAEARSVEQSPDTRFVKAERLNLRAGPSTEETIVLVLCRGTPVFSMRTRADWHQVRTLDGEVGWVYASLVSER